MSKDHMNTIEDDGVAINDISGIPELSSSLVGLTITPTIETTQAVRPFDIASKELSKALQGGPMSDYHNVIVNHSSNSRLIEGTESLHTSRQNMVTMLITITLIISSTTKKLTPSGDVIESSDVELATIIAESEHVGLALGQTKVQPDILAGLILSTKSISYSNITLNKDGIITDVNESSTREYLGGSNVGIISPSIVAITAQSGTEAIQLAANNIQHGFSSDISTAAGSINAIKDAYNATMMTEHNIGMRLLPNLIAYDNPVLGDFSLRSFDSDKVFITIDGSSKISMIELLSYHTLQANIINSGTLVNIYDFKSYTAMDELINVTKNKHGFTGNHYSGMSAMVDTGDAEMESAAVEELSKYISSIVYKYGMLNTVIDTSRNNTGSISLNVTSLDSQDLMGLSGSIGISALLTYAPGLFETKVKERLVAARFIDISNALHNAISSTFNRISIFNLRILISDNMVFDLSIPTSVYSDDATKYSFIHSYTFSKSTLMTEVEYMDGYYQQLSKKIIV